MSASTTHEINARMTELIDLHRPALVRFVRQFTRGRHHTTEDVVQETLIRAWRHLNEIPADADSQRRWLFTIAHRLSIDDVRRGKARRAVPTDNLDVSRGPAADEVPSVVLAADALRSGVDALTPAQRDVITELYVHNRTAREAADRLNIPLGTVRSRQHYAIRTLRNAVLGTV